jgi:hypothetical protein
MRTLGMNGVASWLSRVTTRMRRRRQPRGKAVEGCIKGDGAGARCAGGTGGGCRGRGRDAGERRWGRRCGGELTMQMPGEGRWHGDVMLSGGGLRDGFF